jgi:hypothetical protein
MALSVVASVWCRNVFENVKGRGHSCDADMRVESKWTLKKWGVGVWLRMEGCCEDCDEYLSSVKA